MNEQPRAAAMTAARPVRIKRFQDNIHSLRALAIVIIVAGHACWEIQNSSESFTLAMLSGVLDNGSILFVFVAGYLFAHLSANYSYGAYLEKKFKHVIVPYLIVSVPAIAIALAWHATDPALQNLHGHSWLYQIGWYYSKGGAHLNYALWFIPMIAIYYLAAPLFMIVMRKPVLYLLIIPLSVLSATIKRPPYPNLDILHLAVYMLPAYLLGMWANEFGEDAISGLKIPAWCMWALIGGVTAMPLLASSNWGNFEESGYFTFEHGLIDWLFVQKMLLALLLTIALKDLPRRVHGLLAPLAATSFAIFFLHVYCMKMIRWTHVLPNHAVGWLVLTLLTLIVSYAIARAVNALWPRYSQFLIGYG